jgi:hypothetical protein
LTGVGAVPVPRRRLDGGDIGRGDRRVDGNGAQLAGHRDGADQRERGAVPPRHAQRVRGDAHTVRRAAQAQVRQLVAVGQRDLARAVCRGEVDEGAGVVGEDAHDGVAGDLERADGGAQRQVGDSGRGGGVAQVLDEQAARRADERQVAPRRDGGAGRGDEAAEQVERSWRRAGRGGGRRRRAQQREGDDDGQSHGKAERRADAGARGPGGVGGVTHDRFLFRAIRRGPVMVRGTAGRHKDPAAAEPELAGV